MVQCEDKTKQLEGWIPGMLKEPTTQSQSIMYQSVETEGCMLTPVEESMVFKIQCPFSQPIIIPYIAAAYQI